MNLFLCLSLLLISGNAFCMEYSPESESSSSNNGLSEKVLQKRPNVDTVNDRNNNTPTFKLAAAIQYGEFTDESVEKLLKEGAHPHPRYCHGPYYTYEDLLTHAVDRNASFKCIAMLLKAGADDSHTHLALKTAAKNGRSDLVKLLLEDGKTSSKSPLFACWKKQNINVPYAQKPEPTDEEIEARLQITRLLLAAGYNPAEENHSKETAAQLALKNYNIDIQPLIEEAYRDNAVNDIHTLFEDKSQQ